MHSNSRIGVLWSGFRSFASISFAEIKYAGGAGPGLGRRVGQLFWCTRTPSRSRYFLRDLREDFGEACWSVRPGGVTSQSVYVSAAPGIQVGGVDFERMWLTCINFGPILQLHSFVWVRTPILHRTLGFDIGSMHSKWMQNKMSSEHYSNAFK